MAFPNRSQINVQSFGQFTILISFLILAASASVVWDQIQDKDAKVKVFNQEFHFYESRTEGEGNVFIFRNHIPDTAQFNVSQYKKFCASGNWVAYAEKYYQRPVRSWMVFGPSCTGSTVDFRSARYLGSGNTGKNGVSLYTGEKFQGEEIFITQNLYGGVTVPIKSMAYSGTTNYTFFEGSNFDGKSVCVPPGIEEYYASETIEDLPRDLKLNTVGSLAAGCIDSKDEAAKELLRTEWRLRLKDGSRTEMTE